MEAEVKAFELRELWRRYKEGDDGSARERLVVAYSPLVKFVAGRTGARLPSHVDQADLISYGMIGLIEAMERFDPRREIRFETFAMQRIRGAIIDELRSLDWVPRSVRSRARDIEEANSKLEHELGRAPTDGELAEQLGMSEEDLQEALLQISNSSILALEELWMTPDASGDKVSLLDTIEDESAPDPQAALDTSEVKDRLSEAIQDLPERETLVVALYYFENLTLREIGEVLGVTESRVSQLHSKAVLRLRSKLKTHRLSRGGLATPARPYRVLASCPTRPPTGLRNVALIGHRGSGKTSLHEALLFEAGVVNRLGRVEDGTTTSDYEADEQAREMSIGATVSSFEHDGRKINLIDTPGEPSFIADTVASLRVADAAVVVVNGVMGVEVHTDRLWQRADEEGLARLVFVNMLDRERADFFRALESLQNAFGNHVVATEIPIGSEHEVRGVIDLIDMKAFIAQGEGRGAPEPQDIPEELARRRPRSTARS